MLNVLLSIVVRIATCTQFLCELILGCVLHNALHVVYDVFMFRVTSIIIVSL